MSDARDLDWYRAEVALLEHNFAKYRRESSERHFAEIKRITALAGDAAKVWNKVLEAQRDGRKTVRIADLLEGIDQ